jgi:hypothetical protein
VLEGKGKSLVFSLLRCRQRKCAPYGISSAPKSVTEVLQGRYRGVDGLLGCYRCYKFVSESVHGFLCMSLFSADRFQDDIHHVHT